MTPLRILAIHAHPDDVEIIFGGTLLHLAGRGHHITIVTMTAGDCGSVEYGPEETARIRKGEAARAAGVLGADYMHAGFDDLNVFSDDPSRRRVTEVLRIVRPDLVITSSPDDYHCDHEATSMLVRDACFAAPAPNYRTGAAAALDHIPHLYYCDSESGIDRQGRLMPPHFIVDVSEHMARKAEALACHESQRNWLKKHHGMDNYVETMYEWSRRRGKLARIEYGEGFRHYTRDPYPKEPLLEQLLDGVVRTRIEV